MNHIQISIVVILVAVFGVSHASDIPEWVQEGLNKRPFFLSGNADVREKRFSYVGTTKSGFSCLNVEIVWGEALRSTKRLLVFSPDRRLIGWYGGLLDFPTHIEGNTIVFPYEEKFGNQLILDGAEVPSQLWIDGETHTFESVSE